MGEFYQGQGGELSGEAKERPPVHPHSRDGVDFHMGAMERKSQGRKEAILVLRNPGDPKGPAEGTPTSQQRTRPVTAVAP